MAEVYTVNFTIFIDGPAHGIKTEINCSPIGLYSVAVSLLQILEREVPKGDPKGKAVRDALAALKSGICYVANTGQVN